MKLRVLALVAVLALAAAPAFAYVMPGALMGNEHSPQTKPDYGLRMVGDNYQTIDFDPVIVPLTKDHTTQPVPEPGTMALASMGLMALGASVRRRLGR